VYVAGSDRLVLAAIVLERIGCEEVGAAGQAGVAARDEGISTLVVVKRQSADIGRPGVFASEMRQKDRRLGISFGSLEQREDNEYRGRQFK